MYTMIIDVCFQYRISFKSLKPNVMRLMFIIRFKKLYDAIEFIAKKIYCCLSSEVLQCSKTMRVPMAD